MELNLECGISKNIEKNLRHYISHAKMRKGRLNHQNKLAPSLSADEMLSKRKELINETRKCSRQKFLDSNRAIETPKKQTKQERTLEKANKIKQKLLDWKIEKEKKKQKSLNKLKPFVTGTVKTPLAYVPPPPLPSKLKNAKEKYSKILGGAKPPQPVTFKAGPSHQSKIKRKDNKENIENGMHSNEFAFVGKFETQLNTVVDQITNLCSSWDKLKMEAIPESVKELVLAATGQGRLLLSQKLMQFRSLIMKSKQGTNVVNHVTEQDLQGFWDTVDIQVQDINNRFGKLKLLKANNWMEEKREEKPKAGVKENRKKGICDELPLTWAPSKPGTSYEYAEPAVASCSGITPNRSVVMKVEDVTNSIPTKESATTKSTNKDSKEKMKPVATSRIREMVLEARMAMKSKKVSPNIKMENIEILEAGFSKKIRIKSEPQSSCDSDPNSPTTPLL